MAQQQQQVETYTYTEGYFMSASEVRSRYDGENAERILATAQTTCIDGVTFYKVIVSKCT
jgi:hypothetical protein